VKNGEGSWFIQKLLTELKEAHSSKYYSTHLLDLLTQVQLTVAMKKGKATPDGEVSCAADYDLCVSVLMMDFDLVFANL